MRIVINHLTRMQPGFICVAGLDPNTRQHIRPVLRGRLSRSLLRAEGGPFDIGALVELGETTSEGVAPEVEDRAFTAWRATYLRNCEPQAFWMLLRTSARQRLVGIFGPELRQTGSTCALDGGKGQASLGCLIPTGKPELHATDQGSVRMRFSDGELTVTASVTDLRLYEDDQKTPRQAAVADLNARLARGVLAILSVGVSREWTKPGDTVPRHWLQVNGIHLHDRPIWRHAEIDRTNDHRMPMGSLDELPF
ncbi:MAG TPA: hypothetical protein VFX31_10920 [Ktedonobacterales bacterium]|nr:hypothetical protein [Ktedonobacterales bacterium]HEX5571893.1 hypothetical protein [Ktedonobacterales bacterium]